MSAIKDKLIDVSEDLKGLGVAEALSNKLRDLERAVIDAANRGSVDNIQASYLRLEGYRAALKILEDALIFEA